MTRKLTKKLKTRSRLSFDAFKIQFAVVNSCQRNSFDDGNFFVTSTARAIVEPKMELTYLTAVRILALGLLVLSPIAGCQKSGSKLKAMNKYSESTQNESMEDPPFGEQLVALKEQNGDAIRCPNPINAEQFQSLISVDDPRTLIELSLENGGLSSDQLSQLARFKKLETLKLGNCKVDDSAILAIAQLQFLRVLNLPQTTASDQHLEVLGKLPNLELLRIGVEAIENAEDSDNSNAEKIGITSKGIAEFCGATQSLRFLHTIGIPLDSTAIDAIIRVESLESLYVDGIELEDGLAEQLLKRRPDLHMHFDQLHHRTDPNKDH